MQKGRDAVWIKQKTPTKKQEDFWLTLEPLPVPAPEKPSAPHEE